MYQPVAIKHTCHEHTGVHTHAQSIRVSGPSRARSCSTSQALAVKGAEGSSLREPVWPKDADPSRKGI